MPFANIEVGSVGPRGRITLNRPDKLNPLSTATLRALVDAAYWLDEQPEVKVVVLSGNEELAAQLVEKSALTLAATKQAVNATSAAIASTSGAWSDADVLLTALSDPESRRVADDYLKRLNRR